MCDVVIATGEMYHDATDLDLPGLPPFEFKRSYSTRTRVSSVLGPGWKHNWDVELFVEEKAIRISRGSDDPETYERSQCDAKQGPLIRVHDEPREGDGPRLIELLYPLKNRMMFCRDRTTAGKWMLIERFDAYGNWTKCGYVGGRLAELADSQGRGIQFAYNGSGLLTTIRVGLMHRQEIVHYRYDSHGRLSEVLDPQGQVQRFEYNRNLIVRHINKLGVSRMFCYDDRDRCVWNWYDVGFEIRRIDYSPDSRTAIVCNSLGSRELYRLNEAGVPEKMVDVLGRQTEWIFDGHGAPLCELLPGGIPSQTATWDPVKRIRRITDARGATTEFESDELGNTTSITNACGHMIRFVYGDRGEIVAAIEPGGERWQYEFDDRGRPRRTIDPKGDWVRATYTDNEILMEDLVGVSGRYRFDDLGNLLSFQDGLGRETRFEYDGQDRLVSMAEPSGRITRWQVDAMNRPVSITDPVGRQTEFRWDVLAGLSATHYANETRVRYERDREGYLVRLIDQRGQATVYEYDLACRLIRVTYPDGLQETFEYDDLDRIVTLTDGRGRTTFTYDEAVNPVEIRWPDGSVQTNEYDELSRLVTMRLEPPPGGPGRVRDASFVYDHRDRITKETNESFTVEYVLDRSGYRSVFRDSSGRDVRYGTNARGLVTRIDDGPRGYGFEYNVADELERIVLPNGMEQRLYFDAGSRLVRREVVSRRGAILAWRNFRYDAAGQMIEMVDWRRGRFEYRYDSVGRLTDVIDAAGRTTERYDYDPSGNLQSSPVYSSFILDPGNRLRQTGEVRYTYDGAGRLASLADRQQRWEYEYGYLDELDRVLLNGKVVAAYEYDLCGRRTCKRLDDEVIYFYYHINNLTTFESSRDGRWDVVHVPGTMAPLAMVHEGRAFFISFDQSGTPTEVWDEDDRLVAVISSQAYGAGREVEWLIGPPFPLPFHFQGQFSDEETGLHYNRFRYYSPLAGRFITQDPIGYAGELNLYIYPPNPVTWIDPLGLACPDPIPLRCGTRKKKYSPCEAKAATAKVDRMNRGKRTRCANASQCRSGRQRQYYEKNCSGAGATGGYDVDHSKEIQQGGPDLCCKNLMPIPATPNRSLGGQIQSRMGCAAFGQIIPTFALGSPCTSKSYTDQCKQDFKPGRKKPGAPPENCEERSGEECEP